MNEHANAPRRKSSRMVQAACFSGLLLVGACGGHTLPVDDAGDGGMDTEAVDAAAANDAADGTPPNAPAECVGTDPFGPEACGTALSERCRALTTERDCESAAPLDLGRQWVCGWTKVTTFSDMATCAVASVAGRCEAYLVIGGPCSCEAHPADSEILHPPCRNHGGIQGPIDRYTSLEVQRTEPRTQFACGPQYVPAEPELCKCLAECR